MRRLPSRCNGRDPTPYQRRGDAAQVPRGLASPTPYATKNGWAHFYECSDRRKVAGGIVRVRDNVHVLSIRRLCHAYTDRPIRGEIQDTKRRSPAMQYPTTARRDRNAVSVEMPVS